MRPQNPLENFNNIIYTKLHQKVWQIRDNRLKLLASAVSMRPGELLCGFNETAEADSAVSMRPGSGLNNKIKLKS